MENKKRCKHKNVKYEPSCNEDGWLCLNCKAKLGFRPDLDRTQTHWKALAILNILHENGIIHVSNGSEGESFIYSMKRNCEKVNRYDQIFITTTLLKMSEINGEEYWQRKVLEFSNKIDKLKCQYCKAGVINIDKARKDGRMICDECRKERNL